jgi:acetyl esterase/lipase
MNIGMYLHKLAWPRPPPPSFIRRIPATVSPYPGEFDLYFYTPAGYPKNNGDRPYPVVVNFHGGGFTIGDATDDCRWARAVNENVNAVLVSVNYRLAPEKPFPTAVEDGVDAVMYLVAHADELNLDPDRIAFSGFSAGGNMSFTVPLRLRDELRKREGQKTEQALPSGEVLAPAPDQRSNASHIEKKEGRIVSIIAWYPPADYTHSRASRKASNVRLDKELPSFFTDLFDASYLYPPNEVVRSSPYLSPGVAPQDMLKGLPDDIVIYTCEFDELLAEGERLRDRLKNELGKNVRYYMIEGVPHAWDKSPNPF